MAKKLQIFTANIAGNARHETLEGRAYRAVPMIMAVEGVLNGSMGPTLYPGDELGKIPAAWNHKPVTVYHPAVNGAVTSACDPVILENQKIGIIMNASYAEGKLKAEAWLDMDRAEKIDNRITDAIDKKTMLELSTGLWSDVEQSSGVWNEKAYDKIARNIVPDHLAILPDQQGACSINDGAGFFRANRKGGDGNEVNTIDDSAITAGQPVEVVRVVEYSQQRGDIITNTIPEGKEKEMDKEKLIDGLIENVATQWSADDREFLMTLNEEQLEKMTPVVNDEEDTEPSPAAPPAKQDAPPAPAQNKKPAPQEATPEQYIENAPPAIRDMLAFGLQAHNRQKDECIATITANEANVFTKEYLQTLTLNELSAIAAIAAKPAKPEAPPMFNGLRQVRTMTVTNDLNSDPLDLPSVFSAEK